MKNPLLDQTGGPREDEQEQVKVQVSKILPKIEKTVNEQLEAEVLTRASNSSKTSYDVASNLSELELKKILTEKMERNKSIHRSDEQRNLYKALVDAYECDKIILYTYRDTITLKRRRDDEDKDEEPSAGSDRGSKRRRADVHTTQVLEDTHVTLTPVNPDGQQQSSHVSSQFVTNMLNPSPDTGIDSLFESTRRVDVPVTTTVVPLLVTAPTLPPPTIHIISQVQQAPAPSPATAPSTFLHDLLNFGSLFGFDHRLKTLEANFSEFM
nr:hypothetical protein [Tanacetum cinerariifolium]